MKLKNRTIIYTILRTYKGTNPVVLDSFATYESCKNKCDEYAQQFLDNHIEDFTFEPMTSMYYEL